MPQAVPSEPLDPSALLHSSLWRSIATGSEAEHQSAIFQPVGGMDRIAQALYQEVKDLVQFDAKVVKIDQDAQGVTVSYTDSAGKTTRQAHAQWCLCTIPLSILSQIDIQVGDAMQAAIRAVPYGGSVKVGLQFRRRFWEEDEHIFGGITYTDLPIENIAYPSSGYGSAGRGILLGAYVYGAHSIEFTAMTPAERIQAALQYGRQIHPQYDTEFECGMAVAWYRAPFSLGCFGYWPSAVREAHYENLCQIDGRIALAGEHASYLVAWQEGAVLSSLDAIGRMHAKIKGQA
jgi:monoamine oxidase